jgi:predicted nucleic acid-binding protein
MQARDLDNQFAKQHLTVSVAAPSIMELVKGLHLDTTAQHVTAEECSRIIDILNSLVVLGLDQKSAMLAGEIEARLVNKGLTLDVEDIMIAAIAITHGEPLVTRNTKHFGRIPDLKIMGY